MKLLRENEIAEIIVDVAFQIHRALGPGLFESVYEEIMFYELKQLGLDVERQKTIPVIWKNLEMPLGFRSDLIVENKVIIEIKSIETLNPVHAKQLLTYLRLTDMKLGLLFNFNEPLLKYGIKRLVNNL
ncbi:MAG TPA: GxxExxY protein [Flavobacteriales bacterium]|nr:GxxExxY protein [Flavobacteriales bacterium]